ncbi:MAG: amidotransferase 1, exosortase A system-associated [Gammaproteobacteria bacterium]|nr:MAG: amidotransferase 1, exosortase A system-associated [Gammaproteobacteria bacterium]
MCGVVGVFDGRGRRPVDAERLARLNDLLAHRGPDAAGVHVEPGVGLAHRRLSIIDLAGGGQPLRNEDGRVWVTYNGEIYNHGELAQDLRRAGHRFRSRCDTEVIVHGWEQWGADCVQRFRGMFAFGLYDAGRETLFLARDRLGIKPLYWTLLPDGRLWFASELKALLALGQVPRVLDERAVEAYFALGYVPDPLTVFAGVHKLAPGQRLLWRRGEAAPRLETWWDLPAGEAPAGEARAVEVELLERLREAVDLRRVAEVPLGAFLSGGIDSSAVVALLAGLDARPVKTFSIAFSEPRYDESHWARQVATRYGCEHHEDRVEVDDFALIDRLAGLYDEPFADSSALPTYRVCEAARRQVVVALSGDGGDENFAGYRRHRWHMNEERIRARLPLGLRRAVFGPLGALWPKLDWAPKPLRAKSTLQALARDSAAAYLHSVGVTPAPLRGALFSAALRRRLDGFCSEQLFAERLAEAPRGDALSRIQYLDFKTYLPGDILTKVDRASMAHGLEVRVPILDHAFVEWVWRLPASLKLHRGEGKHVFKRALRGHLPNGVLDRRKMGFAVPVSAWFRGPLRTRLRAALLGPVLRETGLFDMRFVERLVDRHQQGRGEHGAVLWALLMFEAFCRNALDIDAPRRAAGAS